MWILCMCIAITKHAITKKKKKKIVKTEFCFRFSSFWSSDMPEFSSLSVAMVIEKDILK